MATKTAAKPKAKPRPTKGKSFGEPSSRLRSSTSSGSRSPRPRSAQASDGVSQLPQAKNTPSESFAHTGPARAAGARLLDISDRALLGIVFSVIMGFMTIMSGFGIYMFTELRSEIKDVRGEIKNLENKLESKIENLENKMDKVLLHLLNKK